MPLLLSAISDNRALLGDQQTKEFAACGGTIGRSPDNDWVHTRSASLCLRDVTR